MARTAIQIDRNLLVKAIETAEANGPLNARFDLFNKVAEIYNGLPGIPAPITFSVVMLRVKEWSLPLKTPLGKRGRHGPLTPAHKAALLAGREANPRQAREVKFNKNADIKAAHEKLRVRTPVRLHVLVRKIEKGSMKAAVKLQCIQCMGYEDYHTGIRDCTSKACPLYAFRPYQPGTDSEAADAADHQLEEAAA